MKRNFIIRARIGPSVFAALCLLAACQSADRSAASGEVRDADAPSEVAAPETSPVIKRDTLDFKLKYSITLPVDYVRPPEPGELDAYPAIFAIDENHLSIHTPLYQSQAPNYFIYKMEDTLVFESAREAHEIDDYFNHLRINARLVESAGGDATTLQKGDASFFRFPSASDSLDCWVMLNNRTEKMQLYQLSTTDMQSTLLQTFDCYANDLWDAAVINECRFRRIYDMVIYYNPINNGYFYFGTSASCGTMPNVGDYLVGATADGALLVAYPRKGMAWTVKGDTILREFVWNLEPSVYDELLLDPRRQTVLLTKYDQETFRFDVYEAAI